MRWVPLGMRRTDPEQPSCLEDAYSGLVFGEKFYLVERTGSVQERQALCRSFKIGIEVSNCRWKRGDGG